MIHLTAKHTKKLDQCSDIHHIGQVGQGDLLVTEYSCSHYRQGSIFSATDSDLSTELLSTDDL